MPRSLGPEAIRRLPDVVHERYVQAFGASLHTVYHVAAVLMAVAFALALGMRDVPLRKAGG